MTMSRPREWDNANSLVIAGNKKNNKNIVVWQASEEATKDGHEQRRWARGLVKPNKDFNNSNKDSFKSMNNKQLTSVTHP